MDQPNVTEESVFGDDTKNDTEGEKFPTCLEFMWKWRKCSAFSSHFHHYYIYGDFPTCEVEKENIKKCLKYKASRSEEDKNNLLEAVKVLNDKDNFVMKSSSTVWEFRENPAADWLKKGPSL